MHVAEFQVSGNSSQREPIQSEIVIIRYFVYPLHVADASIFIHLQAFESYKSITKDSIQPE